jgi:predicted DNA-binding transcriptional regulator YafY
VRALCSSERVELRFDAAVATYVAGREWHPSQSIEQHADGSVLMRLDVCIDLALRSWVLGFGSAARVIAPQRLILEVRDEIERARARYLPTPPFEMLRIPHTDAAGSDAQLRLPLIQVWRAS